MKKTSNPIQAKNLLETLLKLVNNVINKFDTDEARRIRK